MVRVLEKEMFMKLISTWRVPLGRPLQRREKEDLCLKTLLPGKNLFTRKHHEVDPGGGVYNLMWKTCLTPCTLRTERRIRCQPFSDSGLSTNRREVFMAGSSSTTDAAKSMQRRQKSLKAVVYCWIALVTTYLV